MSLNYFFVHGGPGLNSSPEKSLLAPQFKAAGLSLSFWDEPSRSRGTHEVFEGTSTGPAKCASPYRAWVLSLERALLTEASKIRGKIHVISHSFSALPTLEIVRRNPDVFASLTFLAPASSLLDTYKNLLRVAARDFKLAAPEKSALLENLIRDTRAVMDDALKRGLELAFQDPALLPQYFADQTRFSEAMTAFQAPGAAPDFESLFSVLADFKNHETENLLDSPLPIRTRVLFGELDPLCPSSTELGRFQKCFTHLTHHILAGASHYLHLDQTENFIALLKT